MASNDSVKIMKKSFSVPSESIFIKNDDGSITTTIKFSDEIVDSDGDVISLSGWEFREKVSFLAHHKREEDPIGRIDKVWVDTTGAFAQVTFHPMSLDPRGSKYAEMAMFGSMPSVSAGFVVKAASLAEDRVDQYNTPLNITKALLMEISLVSIPANERAGVHEENMSIKKSFLGQSTFKGDSMSENTKDTVVEAVETEQEHVPAGDLVATKAEDTTVEKSADELSEMIQKLLAAQEEMKKSIDGMVSTVVDQVVSKMLAADTSENSAPISTEAAKGEEVISLDDDDGVELTESQFAALVADYASKLESAE